MDVALKSQAVRVANFEISLLGNPCLKNGRVRRIGNESLHIACELNGHRRLFSRMVKATMEVS